MASTKPSYLFYTVITDIFWNINSRCDGVRKDTHVPNMIILNASNKTLQSYMALTWICVTKYQKSYLYQLNMVILQENTDLLATILFGKLTKVVRANIQFPK